MAWIERTRSGSLRMVERVKDANGKQRRVSVPLEKDTPRARKAAETALFLKVRENAQPVSEMPLNRAIEEYLRAKDCRESTRQNLGFIMNRVLRILGPDVRLSSITPGTVARAFLLADAPPHTMNRTINAFKVFSKWLYNLDYTEENLGARLQYLKDKRPEKTPEQLYLEPERLQALVDSLHGMPNYFTRFLALTGMRIGEASALTPDDIGEKYIEITKAYSQTSGEITEPKTRASVRRIFIQPELAEMLAEFRKWRALDIMATGLRPATFFYSRTGGLYYEHLFNKILPREIHPHMLRHTHVAILAAQGVSLDAIARRLGHEGTAITKKVYYHVTERQREKDEAALASVRILGQ